MVLAEQHWPKWLLAEMTSDRPGFLLKYRVLFSQRTTRTTTTMAAPMVHVEYQQSDSGSDADREQSDENDGT